MGYRVGGQPCNSLEETHQEWEIRGRGESKVNVTFSPNFVQGQPCGSHHKSGKNRSFFCDWREQVSSPLEESKINARMQKQRCQKQPHNAWLHVMHSLFLPLGGGRVGASIGKEPWTAGLPSLSPLCLEPVHPFMCFLPCKVKELVWDALFRIFLLFPPRILLFYGILLQNMLSIVSFHISYYTVLYYGDALKASNAVRPYLEWPRLLLFWVSVSAPFLPLCKIAFHLLGGQTVSHFFLLLLWGLPAAVWPPPFLNCCF